MAECCCVCLTIDIFIRIEMTTRQGGNEFSFKTSMLFLAARSESVHSPGSVFLRKPSVASYCTPLKRLQQPTSKLCSLRLECSVPDGITSNEATSHCRLALGTSATANEHGKTESKRYQALWNCQKSVHWPHSRGPYRIKPAAFCDLLRRHQALRSVRK